MKRIELKELLREIIREEMSTMDEESQAAKDAKTQGLDNLGFGRYGKDGKVTHIADKGKLTPFSKAAMQRKTGMTFGRGKNANTMYTPSGYGKAQMTEPGKVQRRTPRETPDQQRAANQPMGAYHKYAEKQIVSKIDDKLYDRDPDLLTPHFNQDMSIDDFSKLTGLTPTQMSVYDKYADNYYRAFSMDTDPDGTKRVYIHNPADV